MKEKEIVDFDKMKENDKRELIDEDGKEVGCRICYTHEKAVDVLSDKQFDFGGIPATSEIPDLEYYHPLCPNCGMPLVAGANHGYAPSGFVTVSEENASVPDGEIGLYQIWHCENEKCASNEHQNLFAMMPVPIKWNANHDIHISGGKTYLMEAEEKKFAKDIFEKFKPSIEQYIRRKLNPEDGSDKSLDMWNVLLWCERDVEEAIATWLYEKRLKR